MPILRLGSHARVTPRWRHAARCPPYIPTVWISMCRELGAAEAARRLVVSGDIQTAFDRLVRAG
jgi:hypothetical protein